MVQIKFSQSSLDELTTWLTEDPKTVAKILKLVKAICKEPFKGIGKPEPLKHNLTGLWSRQIDKANRLVYKVTKDEITIISCKYHSSK